MITYSFVIFYDNHWTSIHDLYITLYYNEVGHRVFHYLVKCMDKKAFFDRRKENLSHLHWFALKFRSTNCLEIVLFYCRY